MTATMARGEEAPREGSRRRIHEPARTPDGSRRFFYAPDAAVYRWYVMLKLLDRQSAPGVLNVTRCGDGRRRSPNFPAPPMNRVSTLRTTTRPRKVSLRLRLAFCVAMVALALSSAGKASDDPPIPVTVIRAARLFVPETGRMLDHPVIVIRGNKIESVGSGAPTPAGARVLDLGGATVLPGFIDVHTHLTIDAGSGGYEGLGVSVPRSALTGAKNARLTLLAGFTTVRNVGAEGYSDVALRDAIAAGDVPGPRMQVSGPPLGITGGHCDSNLLAPEFHFSAEGAADGVDAVVHKVREVVKYGADVVKFCASGGVFSKGDNPRLEQYSPAEMQALITEAHRLGRKVATHAHSAISIRDAVIAGVDSVEHGIFLDEEGIRLMKQHHTFLVPTSYPLFWFEE